MHFYLIILKLQHIFAGSLFALLFLILNVNQASSQTFQSLSECRQEYTNLLQQSAALGKEINDCMTGELVPFRDVPTCSYDNNGPYIGHAVSAYPNCSPLKIADCKIIFQQRSVLKVCSQISDNLVNAMKYGDQDAREKFRDAMRSENNRSSDLNVQYIESQRLYSASSRPKTLLLGSYFNSEALSAAGLPNDEDGYSFTRMIQTVDNPYDKILAQLKSIPLSTRASIDKNLREMFPSYSHSNSLMSEKDLEKMRSLLKFGSKPFLSKNKGINAIQKKLFEAIVETHSTLISMGQSQFDEFSAGSSELATSFQHNTGVIAKFEERNRTAARTTLLNRQAAAVEIDEDNGVDDFLSVLGNVLGAVAASQTGAPSQPSGSRRMVPTPIIISR